MNLSARFPERRLALALLGRGVVFWVLLRVMLLTVGIASRESRPFLQLSPPAAIGLVLTVCGLGVVESRRLNEHRFFANLGVSPITASILVVLPSLLAEIVLAFMAAR